MCTNIQSDMWRQYRPVARKKLGGVQLGNLWTLFMRERQRLLRTEGAKRLHSEGVQPLRGVGGHAPPEIFLKYHSNGEFWCILGSEFHKQITPQVSAFIRNLLYF